MSLLLLDAVFRQDSSRAEAGIPKLKAAAVWQESEGIPYGPASRHMDIFRHEQLRTHIRK